MQILILYSLTVLIWGSTWFVINFQLGVVPIELSISYRFLIAALLLFSYCFVRKLQVKFSLAEHLRFAALALMLFGLNYVFMYRAQQHIISALSCIAFSTLLIMNVINSRLIFKTPITKQTYIGGLLGLGGIVALYFPQIQQITLADKTMLGLVLCLIGTFCASIGNMVSIKNQQLKLPVMQTNAWGMLYGGIFMLIAALLQGNEITIDTRFEYVASTLYLSIFGSIVGFGCYLTLLGRIGAQKTSYANVMFPAVAVIFSTLFEGFTWTLSTVIGFSAILLGNVIVLYRRDLFKKINTE